jgi:hypothetical protein
MKVKSFTDAIAASVKLLDEAFHSAGLTSGQQFT